MSDICCREKTLYEEIKDLDISDDIKKRLIDKCERLLKELDDERMWRRNSNHYNYLADTRIQALEQTLANMCVKEFGKAEWQYDEQLKEQKND